METQFGQQLPCFTTKNHYTKISSYSRSSPEDTRQCFSYSFVGT